MNTLKTMLEKKIAIVKRNLLDSLFIFLVVFLFLLVSVILWSFFDPKYINFEFGFFLLAYIFLGPFTGSLEVSASIIFMMIYLVVFLLVMLINRPIIRRVFVVALILVWLYFGFSGLAYF